MRYRASIPSCSFCFSRWLGSTHDTTAVVVCTPLGKKTTPVYIHHNTSARYNVVWRLVGALCGTRLAAVRSVSHALVLEYFVWIPYRACKPPSATAPWWHPRPANVETYVSSPREQAGHSLDNRDERYVNHLCVCSTGPTYHVLYQTDTKSLVCCQFSVVKTSPPPPPPTALFCLFPPQHEPTLDVMRCPTRRTW